MRLACYESGRPMTCGGRRKKGLRCGGFVYICKTCGARGCGIPGCERRGQKSGVCVGCQGTLLTLTK
jgi:hypothetical protein